MRINDSGMILRAVIYCALLVGAAFVAGQMLDSLTANFAAQHVDAMDQLIAISGGGR